jgi:hypothetical protein
MINTNECFGMGAEKKKLPFKQVQVIMWMLIAALLVFFINKPIELFTEQE